MTSSEAPQILRLVGVYDADGTIRGELTYWVGARLGRKHCSLCEITHGLARETNEWKSCRAGLPVAFDTFHRDDQPSQVRAATNNSAPSVLAETAQGYVVLLGRNELEKCNGSGDLLVAAIEDAATRLNLTWTMKHD